MKNYTRNLKTPLFLVILFLTSFAFGQSVATYNISVSTIWNVTDHTSVPGNAHWSDLIGATHSVPNEFVSLGMIATMGIKDVAEGGVNVEITKEIGDAITAGSADQLLQAGFNFGPEETALLTNTFVSEDFPYITLVSMVAPSPDWFIAVNSLNLRSGNPVINNGWKATFTMDVFVYDAGTDDGTNYGSSNSPNTPVAVSMINGFPINGNKMATITFTYVTSTLSLDAENTIENIKVFPNPTKGNVTVSNIQNLDLKTLEIYNVLGGLIKKQSLNSELDHIFLNLTNLNQGVYFLRLKSNSGGIKTQKLIIE
ncbi:hypothetical protein A9Q87_07815 [Flavobacteriales bacterium 34_180_T64]|nr:hypothetical protein A9Q87_07815 [Flavobacteriales bacterium 34_180_T64]